MAEIIVNDPPHITSRRIPLTMRTAAGSLEDIHLLFQIRFVIDPSPCYLPKHGQRYSQSVITGWDNT
jgi:hypothetical protein